MTLPAALGENRSLPVIGSPLFIISNPALVIAQCLSGIIGVMPALNARPMEKLDEWLTQITTTLEQAQRAYCTTGPRISRCTGATAALINNEISWEPIQ